MSFEFMEK
jgi:hypothetical protein